MLTYINYIKNKRLTTLFAWIFYITKYSFSSVIIRLSRSVHVYDSCRVQVAYLFILRSVLNFVPAL